MMSDLVTARHLCRTAVIYIRQSSPQQVMTNQESLRLQYALRQRAGELGWEATNIEVVDADLGLSGASVTHREGFKDVIARVTLGEIGIILSYEVTRLARNCSDWYPLLDLCGYRQCLIGDRDGVYDPGSANGRLLLGLKGTISEVELHTLRGRLTAGLLNKAERGELVQLLPAGLERDANSVVMKDPSQEVQDRLSLVFATFLELGSVGKLIRSFRDRGLTVPRRDRFGDIVWRTPTASMLTGILKNPAYAGAFVYGRTRSCHATYPNGKVITERCPMTEWKIILKDRYGHARANVQSGSLASRSRRERPEAIRLATGLGHRTVRRWIRLKTLPSRQRMAPKTTTPSAFEAYLRRRWAEGCTHVRTLLAEVRELGFTGCVARLYAFLSPWRDRRPEPAVAGMGRILRLQSVARVGIAGWLDTAALAVSMNSGPLVLTNIGPPSGV
jgi:DNA invertase Pin-like site-specific DNA recombinase